MNTAHAIEIVHAGPADVARINAIRTEAFDPRFGEAWTASQCLGMLALPGVWLSTASTGGHPAGFAMARVIADEAELLLLAIHPTMRRRRIGTALLRSIATDARERGATTLYLEVRASNDAIELYRAEGFEKIGERHDYYRGKDGRQYDAHTFSRKLD